jgi:hypothetical protein
MCGPYRKPSNRSKRTLRIWRKRPDFATFHCVHCGAKGYCGDRTARRRDPIALARSRAEAAEREREASQARIAAARRVWSRRCAISGTAGERYIREARGYRGHLPGTIAFLPSRNKYPPAIVAAFGIAADDASGDFFIPEDAVQAIHITRLTPDGSSKAGTANDKIMIGRPTGYPIMLAPINDNLGLAITEGIEDALSVHAATGLGAWAAGSAGHMPALADAVPHFVDSVSVVADADRVGQQRARELYQRLLARCIDAAVVTPEQGSAAP